MTSFVPEFIINPVLRQARRLSSTFAASEPDLTSAERRARPAPASDGEGIEEMDEGGLDPDGLATSFSVSVTMADAGLSHSTPRRFRTPSLEHGAIPQPAVDSEVATATRPGPLTTRPIDIDMPTRSAAEPEMASSLPASFYGKAELPEDDGMRTLRRRILDIQSRKLLPGEKARLMHSLLMEGYTRSQIARQGTLPIRPNSSSSPPAWEQPAAAGPLDSFKFWQGVLGDSSSAQTFTLTEEDVRPTYVPPHDAGGGPMGDFDDEDLAEDRLLGCEHYRRNVKLQCFTCERWYTCRLCHNDAEDHILPRQETRSMLCMLCGHAQRAGDMCVKCGASAARYYCGICKLWNDDPDKSIYHCNDCGICRVGEGLGKDFVHCKVCLLGIPSLSRRFTLFIGASADRAAQKCGSCIAITMEASHKCREGAMDCDCPICGEYMFTSHKKVVAMKCGHMIHDACRAEYIKTSYRCPICSKSVENMESQFRRLDKHLEEQPMPLEYQTTRAIILCNDCNSKTSTRYHWGGLKCQVCLSYNTVELQVLNSPPVPAAGRPGGRNSSSDATEGQVDAAAGNTASAALADTVSSSAPSQYARPSLSVHDLPVRPVPSLPTLSASQLLDPNIVADDTDDEGDIFDFWGRTERRNTASAESGDEDLIDDVDDDDNDEDEDDNEHESDVDDEDEDDEEAIVLVGHR